MEKILRATTFAIRAHGDQRRKYSGEPYVVHLLDVAQLVAGVSADADDICAALLHDSLEDTGVGRDTLLAEFGATVCLLVEHLTDRYLPGPDSPNRATRKALEAERLGRTPARVQTIKTADIISNTRDIALQERGFARTYLAENARLLDRLQLAHPQLREQALAAIAQGRSLLWGSRPL